MTQAQITQYLEIPLTTLNDWKKKNSNRSKLYELLINLDAKEVQHIIRKKNNHRFFHILNRNIHNDSKCTFEDIKNAFSKKDYHAATIKEQTIYAKFFKELEPAELEEFAQTFNVSKRDIKNIYISSPFRQLIGVAHAWDKRFRLTKVDNYNIENKNILPTALQNILNRKQPTHV